MFGPRDRRATGIHIVDNTLRIVELGRIGQVRTLHALARKELSFSFAPTYLASDEFCRELAETLRQLGTESGIRFDHPFIALNERAFYFKRCSLLQASRRTNREHLFWEARQFLAAESDEYSIDSVLTPYGGFVVAARRQLLELYVDAFAPAGVVDLDFDIAPFALYNLLESIALVGGEQSGLLLDISPPTGWAILLRDGELAAVSACSWEHGADTDQCFAHLEENLARLLEEGGDMEWPQHLWIAGAAALESDWETRLPARFSMTGQRLDPFKDMDTSPVEETDPSLLESGSEFAVATGLAFRGLYP